MSGTDGENRIAEHRENYDHWVNYTAYNRARVLDGVRDVFAAGPTARITWTSLST